MMVKAMLCGEEGLFSLARACPQPFWGSLQSLEPTEKAETMRILGLIR